MVPAVYILFFLPPPWVSFSISVDKKKTIKQ